MTSLKWALIVVTGAALLAGCGRSSDQQGGEKSMQPAAQPEQQAPAQQPADESSSAQEQTAPETSGQPPLAEQVEVYFVKPIDGSTVTSPVHVEMAARGVQVVPAGTMQEGTGHMHIMVDAPFVKAGEVIPNDEHHLHYGDGSTNADLELKPGKHTLRLEFADGAHKAYKGDQYRDTVHVTVQASESSQEQSGSPDGGQG